MAITTRRQEPAQRRRQGQALLYGLRPTSNTHAHTGASAGPTAPPTLSRAAEPLLNTALNPAQALVYDAVRDVNEHPLMADLPETVMDTAALSAPVALPQPGTPWH